MVQTPDLSMTRQRAVVIEDLRKTLPLGLAALDSHLPEGGLTCGALHEIVPEAENATAAAFGFIAAILARLPHADPLILVMPAYGQHPHGHLHGHGLNA